MKRKTMALLLTALMLIGLFGSFATSSAAAAPKLYINNTYAKATLFTKSSTIMLPVRLIMEELGYSYSYSKNKVTIRGATDTVTFTRGSKYYYENGVRKTLKVASVLKYSMIYAPQNFFTDIMGISVTKGSDGNYYVGSTSTPTATPTAASTTKAIRVNSTLINDEYYVDPYGALYLPLQSISAPLGYTYTQYSSTSAYVTRSSVSSMVEVNSKNYSTNGVLKTLNSAVIMTNNKIYVPLEFMQTVMGGRAFGPVNNALEILTDNTSVAGGSVEIRLNGALMSVQGYVATNGMSYVPLEAVGKALGFTYSLVGMAPMIVRSGETLQVEIYKDSVIRTSSASGIIAGNMGYATEYTNNTVYVPLKFFNDYVSGVAAQNINNVIYISTTGVINSAGASKTVAVMGASYSGYAYTRYVGSSSSTYVALTSDVLQAIGANLSSSGNTYTITESRNGVTTTIVSTTGTNSYSVTKNGATSTIGSHSALEWSGSTLYIPMDIITSNSFLGHAIYPTNDNLGYIIYK